MGNESMISRQISFRTVIRVLPTRPSEKGIQKKFNTRKPVYKIWVYTRTNIQKTALIYYLMNVQQITIQVKVYLLIIYSQLIHVQCVKLQRISYVFSTDKTVDLSFKESCKTVFPDKKASFYHNGNISLMNNPFPVDLQSLRKVYKENGRGLLTTMIVFRRHWRVQPCI